MCSTESMPCKNRKARKMPRLKSCFSNIGIWLYQSKTPPWRFSEIFSDFFSVQLFQRIYICLVNLIIVVVEELCKWNCRNFLGELLWLLSERLPLKIFVISSNMKFGKTLKSLYYTLVRTISQIMFNLLKITKRPKQKFLKTILQYQMLIIRQDKPDIDTMLDYQKFVTRIKSIY